MRWLLTRLYRILLRRWGTVYEVNVRFKQGGSVKMRLKLPPGTDFKDLEFRKTDVQWYTVKEIEERRT